MSTAAPREGHEGQQGDGTSLRVVVKEQCTSLVQGRDVALSPVWTGSHCAVGIVIIAKHNPFNHLF